MIIETRQSHFKNAEGMTLSTHQYLALQLITVRN